MSAEWTTAVTIFLVALLAHEPWRWLGLYLGRGIDVEGGLFGWARAVATALVAGLVVRLLAFPAGALAAVSAPVRVGAVLGGLAIFWLAGRSMTAGVAGGAVLLYAAQLLIQ